MFEKVAMDMLAKERRALRRANHQTYYKVAGLMRVVAEEGNGLDAELRIKARKPLEKAASLHMHRLRGKKNRAERLACRNG